MKKLMTAMAACVFAGAVFAQVESLNIVGYLSQPLTGGNFNMYVVPFEAVGGGDISIPDLLSGDLTPGGGAGSADNILIWNPATSGYDVYYLYDNGDGTATWWKGDDSAEMGTVPPGTTFWYEAKGGNGSVTVAGQVITTATFNLAVTGGNFNMLANPYPVAFDPNDTAAIDWLACGATPGAGAGGADNILIWDASTSGYTVYYLYDNGDSTATWWYGDDSAEADPIPAGVPFWYESKGSSFTAVFKKTF